MHRFYLLTIGLLLFALCLRAQTSYFPPATGTWDTLTPAQLGWCPDKLDSLYNYLGSRNTKAFIILKGGKIVAEKYFGTFTRDSSWYWASAGKSLTSFLIGLARQNGALSLSDTTAHYLGNGWTVCPPAKEKLITVRNQLTMTTGLDDGVPDNYCTDDTCLKYLADAGTRWAYHTAPYTLLDSVLYKATGLSSNAYLTLKVKTITGMTGLYIPVGYNHVYYSTPRSMARYGLLVLNKGNWNGTQIMTDTAYYNQMVNTSQLYNPAYGYLWWLNGKSFFKAPGYQVNFPGSLNPHAPADMFAALGKNGQMINIVPSQNLVYIRMGDAPGVGEVPISFNDTIWIKLNAVMCGNIPSSVAQLSGSSKIVSIYPNPAATQATIGVPGRNFSVVVTDPLGRVVLRKESPDSKYVLQTAGWGSGVYMVRISCDDGEVVYRKLVVGQQ